ncbi:MAG TPA: metallophosphoesterase [Ignavibacteria bacterium]
MKILHISDFHYSKSKLEKAKYKTFISKYLEHITKIKNIDFIIFTGDLVDRGNNSEDFNIANDILIDPLIKATNIDKSNVFICAGNHDVKRDEDMEMTQDLFKNKLIDNDILNNFVDDSKNNKQFNSSIELLKNYNDFSQIFYRYHLDKNKDIDIVNSLYTSHIRKINNINVGIVTINSSWRAYNNDAYGNLFFPSIFIDKALNDIKDCKYKMMVMHHPISYFRVFNALELENIIHSNFDFLLTGHEHVPKNSITLNYSKSICHIVSPASLTDRQDNNMGYSILEIDDDLLNIKNEVVLYDINNSIFYNLDTIEQEFPYGDNKRNQNKLRKRIKDIYLSEIEEIKDLFVNFTNGETTKDLLDCFEDPVLKKKTMEEIIISRKSEKPIIFSDLFFNNNSYIIWGDDKSGKTSLLKKIQIENLEKFSMYGIIPLYIDLKDISSLPDILTLLKKILKHFDKNTLTGLLKDYKFKILVDNFDYSKLSFLKIIETFKNDYINTSFIICSDISKYKYIQTNLSSSISFTNLFIHDITKPKVRSLSKKLLGNNDSNSKVVERMYDMFNQFHIPINFWTVSLFIFIHGKDNELNFKNDGELLNLYIENILERKSLSLQSNSEISYDNYIDLLANLAYELYNKYKNESYRMNYVQLINFIESYKVGNERVVATTKQIFDYLIEKRIIKEKEDDEYTFRLTGFFEFFLAKYLFKSQEFFDTVKSDEYKYLNFKNEIELLSCFKKDDINFVKDIYNYTQNKFISINKEYEGNSIDENLKDKVRSVIDFTELSEVVINEKPKSIAEQDVVDEELPPIETNIPKENNDKDFMSPEDSFSKFYSHTRYLDILGKTFKNIENTLDSELENKILDFLLLSYCNSGYLFIEEIIETPLGEIFSLSIEQEKEKEEIIKNFLISFIPIIIQSLVTKSFGHARMEIIIHNKLKELYKDEENNQYLIFILNLFLIEVNFEKHFKIIDILIEKVKIDPLRYLLLLKLFFYHHFKCHSNIEQEKYFKEKIRDLSKKINPKLKKEEIDKIITGENKKILIDNKLNE